MTTDYARTLVLNAPGERVLDAITTVPGFKGWWTRDTTGDAAVGGDLVFDFGNGHLIRMHVDVVDRATGRVEWTCLQHRPFDEWNGSKVRFEVEEDGEKTELHFEHLGLTPRLACYDRCSGGWDYFLKSITSYVENGEGTPLGTAK